MISTYINPQRSTKHGDNNLGLVGTEQGAPKVHLVTNILCFSLLNVRIECNLIQKYDKIFFGLPFFKRESNISLKHTDQYTYKSCSNFFTSTCCHNSFTSYLEFECEL